MSGRQFDSTENAELRAKIDEAKRRLPMPALMARLGLGEHAKKEAHCPWHSDEHPSFSVFEKADGTWWHKCFVGCSHGDEIALLVKHLNISRQEAIRRYLDMADFPARVAHKSHEYPVSPKPLGPPKSLSLPESPRSHVYPVSPKSNGQGLDTELAKELESLAARNACTERHTARKRRWQLLRDFGAVEKRIGRELNIRELMPGFDEWHWTSQPFLDPAKTRDDYLATFLAERGKVRVPTGEGDTFNKALEAVSKLSVSELPIIPGVPNAPESWRRVMALHRELSRLSGGKTYFLSCRDAAKACPGLSHQQAYNINLALAQLGMIKIVRVGEVRPNGRRATEFR